MILHTESRTVDVFPQHRSKILDVARRAGGQWVMCRVLRRLDHNMADVLTTIKIFKS